LWHAKRVFNEFRLDAAVQHELLAILEGFRSQCTLPAGHPVPADPGLCRRKPDGSNSYAHLGGVYPIALFVDRLVGAVLQGEQVSVQWDQLDSPGIRHPPGLKYMMTELMCNSLGGPEIVTSKGFEEAKLGIRQEQWDAFMALAGEVARVWPTQRHRDLVLQALTDQKVHICVGLAAETTTSAARQVLAEAGFGVIDQASALEECGQDAERALELLRSGWTPARQMVRTSSNSSLDSLDAMPVSRCPFMAVTSSVAASSSAATSSANRWAGSAGEAPGFKGLDAISETARVLKESGSSDEEVQDAWNRFLRTSSCPWIRPLCIGCLGSCQA